MKLLLLALVLLAAPRFASEAPMQTTLQRYANWRGGQAFVALRSVDETGTFMDGGLQGAGRRYADIAGDLRSDSSFGVYGTGMTVAGGKGAYTDLAGQRLPLSPFEVTYARADATGLMPISATSGRVYDHGTEIVAGRSWQVVTLDKGEAGAYDYLVAPSDGELFGIRVHRNGANSMRTFSDWRWVDGVRMPFKTHEEGQAGLGALQSDTTDFTVRAAKLNGPAPEWASTPLRDRDSITFARGTETSGWVPFQLLGHAIFLEVKVNGRKVRVLLDSGASQTAIDTTYARNNSIIGRGQFTTGGQGGSITISYAPGVDIDVGGMHADGLVANLIDFSQPGTQMSPPLVAILGAEVFAQAAVDIDYQNRRIRFTAPARRHEPSGGVTLPLNLFEGAFYFPVSVEGGKPIPILLDTGSEGTFQLFPAYWQAHRMLDDRPVKDGSNGGVGGIAKYKVGALAEIAIGSIPLRNVPVVFEMPGNPVNNETGILGNCGDAVLERFHVLVDFPDRTIKLEKNAVSSLPFKQP